MDSLNRALERSISGKWAPEYVMPRDYYKAKEFDIVFERRFGK